MSKKDSNRNNYINKINRAKEELIDRLNILRKLKPMSNNGEIKKIEETMMKILSILEAM